MTTSATESSLWLARAASLDHDAKMLLIAIEAPDALLSPEMRMRAVKKALWAARSTGVSYSAAFCGARAAADYHPELMKTAGLLRVESQSEMPDLE